MRFLKSVFSAFTGIRLLSFVLMIALTITLFQCANEYSKIQRPFSAVRFFDGASIDRIYYAHRSVSEKVRTETGDA